MREMLITFGCREHMLLKLTSADKMLLTDAQICLDFELCAYLFETGIDVPVWLLLIAKTVQHV